MNIFSLFSGIGGFDLAAKRLGHRTVGACEIDKYARTIFSRQFPGVKIWHDVREIKPAELPKFDCLTAGFPCPTFSIAGKRLGFKEPRGELFFEIARIAKQTRPELLLLENVKGLLSHDSGRTFAVILSTLDELGYDAEWQMLNSKYHVPQNRERIFIIGHLRGKSSRQVFPLGEIDKGTPGKNNLRQLNTTEHDTGRIYDPDGLARSLRAVSGGYGSKTGLYCVSSTQDHATVMKEQSPALTESMGTGGGHVPMITKIAVKDHDKLRETADESLAIDANYWKGPDNHGQRTMVMLTERRTEESIKLRRDSKGKKDPRRGKELVARDDGLANCVTSAAGMEKFLTNGAKIRRLTPVECERLQGFPDGYTEGVSDTQRYKCLGNAVTVPVVQYIMEKMFS